MSLLSTPTVCARGHPKRPNGDSRVAAPTSSLRMASTSWPTSRRRSVRRSEPVRRQRGTSGGSNERSPHGARGEMRGSARGGGLWAGRWARDDHGSVGGDDSPADRSATAYDQIFPDDFSLLREGDRQSLMP